VKEKTGYNIDVWPGFCYIHELLTIKDVEKQKNEHPDALLLVHPEAPIEVLRQADFVGSTKNILDYATKSEKREFIIGTDKGIIHALKKANPDKTFHLLSRGLNCINMKRINLEDLYLALRDEVYEIKLDESIRVKAVKALDKMMELS
jgi:quinolinate synthase